MAISRRALIKAVATSGALTAASVAGLPGVAWAANTAYLMSYFTETPNFTGYRRIRMHTLNAYTWAPTAFWDSTRGQYGIVYPCNSGGDVLMVNYTSDFVNVSGQQVFFSPGFGVLDGDIVDGGTTYLYYKNLSTGLLHGARSSTGAPNSFTTYTSGLRMGNAIEAPLLVRNNDGSGWRLWGDSFSPVNADYYIWSTSSIGSNSWVSMNQRDYTPPLNAKHGSILGISDAGYDGLVSRWGTPNWVRLKSSNLPDYVVRHSNGVGRIDPYPFDPYQDQMWRMVPGLADVAWTSLRSHNFPDRFLRHANYLLRIDPLSASSGVGDRQDATFRITP